MTCNATTPTLQKKWFINNFKTIKILNKNGRIAFQRHSILKYARGVSITKEAFLKMRDVTIVPGDSIELQSNVYLKDYGNEVYLTRYCFSMDDKRCNGGFFTFTPKEWINFWTNIRGSILECLNK